MKAIVINAYGSSERLTPQQVDAPRPGKKEVLIRIRAAGVNPVDWKIRRGMLRPILWLKLPVILGLDVAGVVEAVGSSVTRYKPGDHVLAMLSPPRLGGYAEYAVAPESAVALKVESLSFVEAAGIPVAGLTALQALRDLGRLGGGNSVLVNGASGGVGTFAVQIAKALGCRVTAVCGPRNLDLVTKLGADEAVDYTREDFVDRPDRFDVILDAVAKRSHGQCQRALRSGGVYITTLPSVGVMARMFLIQPILNLFSRPKNAKLILASARGDDLAYLGRLAEEGKLRPVIDRTYPLELAREAHDYCESERARGKVVLEVP